MSHYTLGLNWYPNDQMVINKPGAGGIVAFEDALQMPADGHTLLAVTRSNISKLVATNREDLIDRLDWHSYLMDNAHVVITNVAEGMTSWEDVVASAEERGNSLWCGGWSTIPSGRSSGRAKG